MAKKTHETNGKPQIEIVAQGEIDIEESDLSPDDDDIEVEIEEAIEIAISEALLWYDPIEGGDDAEAAPVAVKSEPEHDYAADLQAIYRAAEKVAAKRSKVNNAKMIFDHAKAELKAREVELEESELDQALVIADAKAKAPRSAGPLFAASEAKAAEVADPEAWRSVRLDSLDIGGKALIAMAEHSPSLLTVGDVAELGKARGDLTDVKGIGPALADQIADTLAAFHAGRAPHPKPDAMPGVKEVDWRSIKLAAPLKDHSTIAAKLAARGFFTTGSLANFLTGTNRSIEDEADLTAEERDTLATEIDRMCNRIGGDLREGITREMLGFDPEPLPAPSKTKKPRKAPSKPATVPFAART